MITAELSVQSLANHNLIDIKNTKNALKLLNKFNKEFLDLPLYI